MDEKQQENINNEVKATVDNITNELENKLTEEQSQELEEERSGVFLKVKVLLNSRPSDIIINLSSLDETVQILREKLSENFEAETYQVKILWRGRALTDNLTLASCEITEESTLHAVINPNAQPPVPVSNQEAPRNRNGLPEGFDENNPFGMLMSAFFEGPPPVDGATPSTSTGGQPENMGRYMELATDGRGASITFSRGNPPSRTRGPEQPAMIGPQVPPQTTPVNQQLQGRATSNSAPNQSSVGPTVRTATRRQARNVEPMTHRRTQRMRTQEPRVERIRYQGLTALAYHLDAYERKLFFPFPGWRLTKNGLRPINKRTYSRQSELLFNLPMTNLEFMISDLHALEEQFNVFRNGGVFTPETRNYSPMLMNLHRQLQTMLPLILVLASRHPNFASADYVAQNNGFTRLMTGALEVSAQLLLNTANTLRGEGFAYNLAGRSQRRSSQSNAAPFDAFDLRNYARSSLTPQIRAAGGLPPIVSLTPPVPQPASPAPETQTGSQD
eukprot:maker-scaffold_4-snap-gene-12.3-mRNA-1 protein AED:0.01 eAED:0.01 QI:367/1/1/1/0.66/0.57/7/127/502